MKLTDDCFEGDVEKGWYGILHNLVETLNSLGWNSETMQVLQVKEKFGTLRFYAHGVTEEMAHAIRETEKLSSVTCEFCSAPGKLNSNGGWYKTVCSNHVFRMFSKWQQLDNLRWASNGKKSNKQITS